MAKIAQETCENCMFTSPLSAPVGWPAEAWMNQRGTQQ